MAGVVRAEEARTEKVADAKDVVTKEEEVKVEEEVRGKLKEVKVGEEEQKMVKEEGKAKVKEGEVVEEENVKVDVEPKTRVSFPVKLVDGKQLNSLGLRRKKVIALNINIYAFGMYADNAKLKELLKGKFGKAPQEPTKELYEAVINSDIEMMVRLIIVFGALSMSMVRKNFDEGLGASIKKLNGGQKNAELVNMVMGAAKDSIKLSAGSVIEITRLPGYVLQAKVKDELISKVDSELLCRAYFHMYLGDDPFDKEAKERFGKSLLSLF